MHFTDPARLACLSIGVGVSLVKALLDSAVIGAAVGLEMLTLFADSYDVNRLYDDYNNDINQVLDKRATNIQYPDSFYLGRTIGDIAVMAIGVFGVMDGISKIGEGIGVAAGGAAVGTGVSSGTAGAGAAAGIAVIGGALTSAGALIGAGAVELSASIALIATGAGNVGDDFANYDYFKKLACDEFDTNWKNILDKCTKRNDTKGSTSMYTRDNSSGYSTAKSDFESLNLSDTKSTQSSNGYTTTYGTTPNGKTVNLHYSNYEKCWSIEYGNIKIRY